MRQVFREKEGGEPMHESSSDMMDRFWKHENIRTHESFVRRVFRKSKRYLKGYLQYFGRLLYDGMFYGGVSLMIYRGFSVEGQKNPLRHNPPKSSKIKWGREGIFRYFRKGFLFKRLRVVFCLLFVLEGEASLFYQKRCEGWHWYEPKEGKRPQKDPLIENRFSKTPTQEVEALKQELSDLLNKAILYPTRENIIHYRRKQEAFMEQSHTFARMWQKVTFENPALDYNLKFPTQHTGRMIYKKEAEKTKERVLRELSQEYGLFYIFRSDCRYCEAFAPVVQGFSKKYGWDVLAISADGGSSKEFPKAQGNNGILETLKIEFFPTLLAVHPTSHKVIPLAYGLTSLSEMETRAYQLAEINQRSIPNTFRDKIYGEQADGEKS